MDEEFDIQAPQINNRHVRQTPFQSNGLSEPEAQNSNQELTLEQAIAFMYFMGDDEVQSQIIQFLATLTQGNVIHTHEGHELPDLLAFLRQHPKDPFRVSYPDTRTQTWDVGGPTRQIYNQSVLALLKDKNLFRMNEQQRDLFIQEHPQLNKFHDLGLILGRVSNQTVRMAISTSLSPDFFNNLYKAIKLEKSGLWWNLTGSRNLECRIDSLHDVDLLRLFKLYDPKTYSDSSKLEYLHYLKDQGELRDQFKQSIAPYMAIAEGMSATCEKSFQTASELRASIQGIINLKLHQDELFEYKHNEDIEQPVMNAVVHLMKNYIHSRDELQLQHLCESVSGASGIQTDAPMSFSVTKEPLEGPFSLNTCGKTVYFSLSSFVRKFINDHNLTNVTTFDFESKAVKDFFIAELNDSLGQHFNDS